VRYSVHDPALAGAGAAQRLEDAGLTPDKVALLDDLPHAGTVEGCILSNELLDALPVRRVRRRGERLFELLVGLNGDLFVDLESEAPRELLAYFAALALLPGDGCEAEVNLAAPLWTAKVAAALRRSGVGDRSTAGDPERSVHDRRGGAARVRRSRRRRVAGPVGPSGDTAAAVGRARPHPDEQRRLDSGRWTFE
jgi:hypothetical protein